MKKILVLSAIGLAAAPLAAEDVAPLPLEVKKAGDEIAGNAVLPANTEIVLEMTQEVTTKGKTWAEGDQFKLSVADDVMLGEYVVIPEGTPAFGKINWLTNKGMFGKSGKMDIELEYIELANRRIKIDGTYRQEGEGNTLATVGGVVLAGPFAAFITGKSGRIPQGRELKATLEDALELAIPASAVYQSKDVAPLAPRQAVSVAPSTAVTVEVPASAEEPLPAEAAAAVDAAESQ